MKKHKLFMIISVVILIISIGGSLAWYTWASSENSFVSLGMCVPEISFIGGTTLYGDGLKPVTDKSKGLKKQIDVYLNKTCREGDSGVMNLYMKLDLLPDELKEETFIYEVVKDDIVLYSNNFKDKEQGETIELLKNQVITADDSIYFIYVYIDGTRDNPLHMAGKSFRFTVYGEGTGAIYKNNVIATPSVPSNSNSTFFDTQVARSNIQTVTIADNNIVPDGAQYKDISSKGDGSVMLWYTDDNGDNLYDFYIGSENGIVETNTSGQGMFAYLTNVESLDLSNLDTSNITNMSSMFQGSSSLKEINLSNFNTSNVTSMKSMFQGCTSLESIDVSGFDTSNVTGLEMMFSGCKALTELNVSDWDTSKVKSISDTFLNCSSLTTLDVSKWDTSNMMGLYRTFCGCSSLKQLDVSNWDTSKMGRMQESFKNCSSLTILDVSKWDTSSINALNFTFSGCSGLTELDVSNWSISGVTTIEGTFAGCSSLTKLDLSKWDVSGATTMRDTFKDCSSLIDLDLGVWDATSSINLNGMFNGCSSLVDLDLSKFTTEKVTNMSSMFEGCRALKEVDLSGFYTPDLTNIGRMFAYCTALKKVDFRNASFSKVTTHANAFAYNIPKDIEIIIKDTEESKFTTMYPGFSSNLTLIQSSNS